MEDSSIIELYFARDEQAIDQTRQKYGGYCQSIAYNITQNYQDTDECLSDTWLAAWQAIPPQRPDRLIAFLGRITRNLALDIYRKRAAKKRGAMSEILTELSDCLSAGDKVTEALDEAFLSEAIDRFLHGLPLMQRQVFLLRYWYAYSIKEIARRAEWSESKVTTILFRQRQELRQYLESEGILI